MAARETWLLCFLLVGIACIGIIVSLIAQYYSAKAAVGVTKELTNDLYQKVLSLPKSSRDILSSSSLLTRLTSDTLQIQTGINTFLRLFYVLQLSYLVRSSWHSILAQVYLPIF